jgi:hypothetical protein
MRQKLWRANNENNEKINWPHFRIHPFFGTFIVLIPRKGASDARVTRLGEFSPLGRLFTLGSFLIAALALIVGNFFPQSKICSNFDQKCIWLCIFWATFSQTHLVTLFRSE